jgi:hypothetical protein
MTEPTPTPTPWELIEATEHHGAYIVNSWGRTICDLYAMSNPMAASVRNGGTSFPVHFDDMAANAAFIVKAVNNHDQLTADLAEAVRLLDALLGLEKGSGQAALAFIERINGAVEGGE